MSAFRVSGDGQHFGDFGVDDFAVQNVILGMSRGTPGGHPSSRDNDYRVHIGGLTKDDGDGKSYHYRWVPPKIKIGTKILVEIVEVPECLPPDNRHEADGKPRAVEEMFTEDELREMRYEDYVALKKEFDPD